MSDLTRIEERFRMVNPVPDPADPPMSARTAATAFPELDRRKETMQNTTPTQPTRNERRRPWLIVIAAAAIVIIVGVVAFAFVANDGTDVADSDSRVVQLTFDGEQCIYEGPSVLSAGEGQVEVVYHNETSEESFFNFVRLDEGRTTQDMLDYLADPNSSGAPSWTTGVWGQSN
ncbi:MAG: hypothetical protein ACE1ZX_00970, partial [Acidimicrobiia bacterium]